jgi:glycine/D-amino acid oxidase-like deaminating enzyme
MGLMTAYYAAPLAEAVTVLERSRVGDPATASFGLTRSARNYYRQLALQQVTVYDIRRFAPARFADGNAASEPEIGGADT